MGCVSDGGVDGIFGSLPSGIWEYDRRLKLFNCRMAGKDSAVIVVALMSSAVDGRIFVPVDA